MKITKTQLKQIIKEELAKVISEDKISFATIADAAEPLNPIDKKAINTKYREIKEKPERLAARLAQLLSAIKTFKDSERGSAPIVSSIEDI